MSEATYSSALVHLLNRDSQTVRKAMMYPITRIELNEFDDDSLKVARIFVVNDAGKWVEAQ